jgi:RNA polymerase sigma-70 factor, ECF subfamily
MAPSPTRTAPLMTTSPAPDEARWLSLFHAGDGRTMEECYRNHFGTVTRAVGAILRGPDQETVTQDVFCRLLSNADLRRSYQGGSFAAWLATVSRNQALDYRRRSDRERPSGIDAAIGVERAHPGGADEAEARMLVERFRREVLPPKWIPVFEACFLRRLSQREAAVALGMRRTTLAYQELQIRRLMRRFFLEGVRP